MNLINVINKGITLPTSLYLEQLDEPVFVFQVYMEFEVWVMVNSNVKDELYSHIYETSITV